MVIIEVLKADDTTDFIGWQSGTLKNTIDKADSYSVGMSWIPDHPGEYVLMTFVLSNLEIPSILSDVAVSNVTIAA